MKKKISNEKHSNALIIFIKNPEKGKVKTRLAKDVGEDHALDIYIRLLSHTRNVALAVEARRYLFYKDHVVQDEWSIEHFDKRLQHDGDLGYKMQEAFKEVLKKSSKAVIIGSDCAQLSPEIINKAFSQLDSHDVVIGPAFDGGYYLLGMNSEHPELFENMIWSVPTVFDETLSRINNAGLSYAILERLSDIDYLEDWNKHGL